MLDIPFNKKLLLKQRSLELPWPPSSQEVDCWHCYYYWIQFLTVACHHLRYVTYWITNLIKRVAERANILLTWTEAHGRSSFFRNHLPIKLRVVIRFYPQSIPLTVCEDQATSRNEDCIRDICCFIGLLRHDSCWEVSLSPRWFVWICWSYIWFRFNLQIWWPHFFAGTKKSFDVCAWRLYWPMIVNYENLGFCSLRVEAEIAVS